MKPFKIEWDKDYGIDHRCGWTIVYDGVVVAELRKHLLLALIEAWRNVRRWDKEATR